MIEGVLGSGSSSASAIGNLGVKGASERWLREGWERREEGAWRLYATWDM